jgi:hypothetical protein
MHAIVGAKYLTEARLLIRNIAMFQDLTSDVLKIDPMIYF